MPRVNYYLPETYIRRIEEISAGTGLAKSEVIRRAIDELEKQRGVQMRVRPEDENSPENPE